MRYVYAALLLHDLGKEISEANVMNIFKATGTPVDETRIKALVAAVSEINIDEALKSAPVAVAASPVAAALAKEKVPEEKKPEEEEKKEAKEEEALAGLGALFQ